jgi:hypothetical protein
MSDIIDDAQLTQEIWLNAAITAARGVPVVKGPTTRCVDCGEVLEPHRRPYGTCLHCQEQAEARGRWRK